MKDYCVEQGYRNILVILTDGHMYYRNNLLTEVDFSTYITPQTIRSKSLIQSNWKEIIETQKQGFITLDLNLSKLEALVLGINHVNNGNNRYDYGVLEKYWHDWLYSMGLRQKTLPLKLLYYPYSICPPSSIIESP